MAQVIEVRGIGHFVLVLKEGDSSPVQLVPAPVHIIDAEQTAGNVQVIIPFANAPTPPPFGRCPVQLDADATASVAGIPTSMPDGVARRAVTALVGAFPGGLSRQALNLAAKAGDARNALRGLVETCPLWKAALRFPREKGDYRNQNLGYRIADYADVTASMIDMASARVLDDDTVRAAIANIDDFRQRRPAG